MAELGFALIGCGKMGQSEARLLDQIPGARLVAVCDVQVAAADAFGKEMNVPAYAELGKVLARPDVGAVIIATPNTTHPQPVMDAAAAGKHIFCEKPMALTVAVCDQMIAAAEQHNVRLMVGQVLQLLPTFSRIVELFDSGVLGQPVAAQITRIAGFPEGVAPYRLTRQGAGGLLYEITVHEIDLLHRIFGPTRSVFAHIDRAIVQTIDYEDMAQLQLRFQSGASASIFESFGSAIPSYTGTIIATRGTLQFDFRTGHISYRQTGGDESTETVTGKDRENGYLRELRSFTEWVLEGKQPLLSAHEGRAAIAVVEAAYTSARTGQAVDVAP